MREAMKIILKFYPFLTSIKSRIRELENFLSIELMRIRELNIDARSEKNNSQIRPIAHFAG